MINWRRMWTSRITDCGIILILATGIIRIAMIIPERANCNDFAHFYVSSRLMLEDKTVYGVPLEPGYEEYGFEYDARIYGATNPPALVYLFMAFAAFPPAQAYAFWTILQSACLVAVLIITRQVLSPHISLRAWWLLSALTLISLPVYYHFYFSQVQLLLAAAVYGALLLLRQGRGVEACVVVTLAGMLKLFPFVLLPWFIWTGTTKSSTRICRLVASLVVAGFVVCLTGIGPWNDFLNFGIPVISSNAVNQSMNFSLPSFGANIGYAMYDFQPTEDMAVFLRNLGAVCGLMLLVAAYLAVVVGSADQDTQFSILCVAMVLGGVTAWMHYFVFLIFPMAIGAIHVAERPMAWRVTSYSIILVVVLEVCAPHVSMFKSAVFPILIHYIPLYAVLGLAILLVLQRYGQIEEANGPESDDRHQRG